MITAMKNIMIFLSLLLALSDCGSKDQSANKTNSLLPSNMFEYSDNIEPRWVSFENIRGEKGQGGMENNGAKGHACDSIRAGSTKTLLNIAGPGIINRIWVTISDRSPSMLRSLVLKMYWDKEEKPAVSVPFGDFFGIGLGKTTVYENALFANPEGRSFNCFIQMPFKKAARVELVNESGTDLPMVFYDIDLQLLKNWDKNFLYFHSYWHRDTATMLARDFEIMPSVKGKGRFLGSNISINANAAYKDCWWGEGEVKIYLDGDNQNPTLVGSGTEDYIGTAWGQGQFFTKTTGCLIADSKNLQWAFYRYHISDPVYFKTDCKVTIQQIGGNTKDIVIGLQKNKVRLIPVTVHEAPRMIHIYKKDSTVNLEDKSLPNAWTNFYRSDDLAATSYFYLDSPKNDLPALQTLKIRTYNLKK
jgi:D-arabinan exo alpha-(1,3)/(1,5)-arabinofuranosidase (non-reducing end)